jgi:hypothetical protein
VLECWRRGEFEVWEFGRRGSVGVGGVSEKGRGGDKEVSETKEYRSVGD